MSQQRGKLKEVIRTSRQTDQSICHFCGSRLPTKDALREHQLYCSDPGFCLCHVDRDGFLDS